MIIPAKTIYHHPFWIIIHFVYSNTIIIIISIVGWLNGCHLRIHFWTSLIMTMNYHQFMTHNSWQQQQQQQVPLLDYDQYNIKTIEIRFKNVSKKGFDIQKKLSTMITNQRK